MRMTVLPWLLWALIGGLALAAVFYAARVNANHDDRDPDGICFKHAGIAYRWAAELRDAGKSKAETEKLVSVTPEQLEAVPEAFRKLVIQHTLKGIELVYETTPQKTADEVAETFYDWCLGTLPKGPGA